MNVDPYKRVTRQDLGAVPEWVDKFLDPIQRQLEILSQVMQHNITVADNMASEVRVIDLTNGVEAEIKLSRLTRPPSVVFCGWASLGNITGFAWRVLEQQKIGVTVTTDASAGAKMTARIVSILE